MENFILQDGVRLHVHDWPAAQPKARLLVAHGLGEHGGRYEQLARELNALGISVRACDQRGHGLSEGARGAVPRGDALAHDLLQVFAAYESEAHDTPFLLGHSMGGLLATHATVLLGLKPRGLVVSSPALATRASGFERWLARTLQNVLPNIPVSNGLKLDKLSHDADVIAAYRDDPLVHGRITPRLAQYFFDTGPQAIANAGILAAPTLLQIAGSDRLVDPAGAREFASLAPPALLQAREYATAWHEIYNEAEPLRSQVLGDLRAWLGARMNSAFP